VERGNVLWLSFEPECGDKHIADREDRCDDSGIATLVIEGRVQAAGGAVISADERWIEKER
jgi:hypothetical protein